MPNLKATARFFLSHLDEFCLDLALAARTLTEAEEALLFDCKNEDLADERVVELHYDLLHQRPAKLQLPRRSCSGIVCPVADVLTVKASFRMRW